MAMFLQDTQRHHLGREKTQRRHTEVMARVLQQRQKAWWLEKTSERNDRGRENKARKNLGKAAAGMGNKEVPTTREIDC